MNNTYKAVSAQEAVKVIKSGDHIHLSSVASAPQCLIDAMCERGRNKEFKNVYIHHLHTEGAAPYASAEFEGVFQHDAFFVGANVRKDVQAGYADYIPIFLSETQKLYREGYVPSDDEIQRHRFKRWISILFMIPPAMRSIAYRGFQRESFPLAGCRDSVPAGIQGQSPWRSLYLTRP